LEAVVEAGRRYSLPVNDMRPVLQRFFKQIWLKVQRNQTAYIIATDLINRQKKTQAEARRILFVLEGASF